MSTKVSKKPKEGGVISEQPRSKKEEEKIDVVSNEASSGKATKSEAKEKPEEKKKASADPEKEVKSEEKKTTSEEMSDQPVEKEDVAMDNDSKIKEEPCATTLETIFGVGDEFVINQCVEKIEAGTLWASLGCCKVETENSYILSNFTTDAYLLQGQESSNWLCRNPCILCDCVCWCCHSSCSKRRSFRMPMVTYSQTPDDGNAQVAPLFVLDRPYRSDCLPCSLQSIYVRDGAEVLLGSVQQVFHLRWGFIPACQKFGVFDDKGNRVFDIQVPCILTTFCFTQATFSIFDMNGDQVGEIAKVHGNIGKEAFTDSDKFKIRFPNGIDSKMKATLIGALVLFDYIFYEY